MAFPETLLPIQVDISLDGTTWTDITSSVRGDTEQIRITRGRSDWGQQVDFGRCALVLSNNDGRYSPRNPSGAYYGQIGRNTPIRVSVNTGSVALDLPGDAGDYASTPDTAALDITGDIDIRIDATLENWILPDSTAAGQADWPYTELIAKRSTGQVSWGLYIYRGRPYFEWTTNGSTINTAHSSYDLPLTTSGRIALRYTMDVDNGAGGFDIAFYTADTIAGPWTLLDSGTGAGTTSIYSGTADLRIGDCDESTTRTPALGRVHAAQVYSGIAGTAVANPDFTAQTSGTTSFADAAGRTWSLAGNTEITNRKVRFSGEIASWTPRWSTGGLDVVTEVEAAGVLRRLGIGAVPTKSPMYREFTSPGRMTAGIVAYWPMEDGAEATQLASAYSGHPAMTITGTVTPAAYSSWVASAAIPTVDTGSLTVSVPSYTVGATAVGRIGFFAKVPSAGVVSTQRLVSLSQTGTATTWSVYVNTSGNLDVRAYDVDGTQIHAAGFGTDSINGLEKYAILTLAQNGTDVDYTLNVYDIADSLPTAIPDNTFTYFTITGTVASYTTGRITRIRLGEDGAMNDTAVGHLSVGNTTSAYYGTGDSLVGLNAEEAPSRIARLGTEESLHAYASGPGGEQCGPQPSGTALEVMRAAEAVDNGILAELRSVLGLRYVTRTSMYNQAAALTLDYTGSDGLVAPLNPTDDDQSVTNDVTVARTSGASARATQTTGALSTQTPPAGIGLYDTSYTLNLLNDSQPQYHAGWRLHVGTWDETRYPVVSVNLATAPASIEDAAAVDVGSRVQITNPPSWLPPDTIDLLVQGYTEILANFTWSIDYNCAPAGPWTVAVADDADLGKADTAGAELAAALTSTATTAYVLTTEGPVWTADGAQYPFDLRISGEVMTATACTSWLQDTFTRTVANGWGTPDTGSAWTTSGGSASDYAVGSGYGSATLASVDVSRRTIVTAVHADADIYCDITTSALATGDSLYGSVTARYTDSSNMYLARLEFTTANAIVLSVYKMVASALTSLGTYTLSATHVAGTFVRVRFQVQGTALRARAWLTTASEPSYWQVEATDSALTAAGSIGTRSIAGTLNTNVNPAVRYDNFEVINPQTMTVTRSVNGVVKAQSAATSLSLAQPAVAAL